MEDIRFLKTRIDKKILVLLKIIKLIQTYVPEQCNDEKLKKVLKVNDFRHFFLDFIIVTYYN